MWRARGRIAPNAPPLPRAACLCSYAREHQPCIIFMDEIDAIGGKRFSEGTSADREVSLVEWSAPRHSVLHRLECSAGLPDCVVNAMP